MRQFIRHPADVPIQIRSDTGGAYAGRAAENVSYGGLAFSTDAAIEPDTLIGLLIPHVQPPFEVSAARVAWCRHEGERYLIGVQFPDSEVAFRVRMVEQVCHIKNYRKLILEHEGRELTTEEAAVEWMGRYASSFPNP
jgi:PilZ domain